ncbi:hypothetical protein DFP93_11716 [Aneurinibacillus soli]|uniref:Citrate transporter n=1 Tax=Aneurinibacillus soli TaxID=1500254 RepID=A0A0U4NKI5_9BACL|nr:GntP family permease [Aneurinibacillus soli]PYE59450.1 hypothetical protein DFP93_11716 [Aneurinibacillus soli]BAU29220.1 Citrate transporter [Aneurinibacillus soli]
MIYLESRRRKAKANGEGYGIGHKNEPEPLTDEKLPNAFIAILPLIIIGVFNKVFTGLIPQVYGKKFDFESINIPKVAAVDVTKETAIWAVEGALVLGILTVLLFSFTRVKQNFNAGINASIGGALLATLNTASEYGFGGIIALLPGITGSASGGMSIALATMGDKYLEQAEKLGINPEVMHRVASMASGGMDTLPRNGAVITLLAVAGLTHRQSYIDIFAMRLIKTLAVFL